jgi:hypothetical protein
VTPGSSHASTWILGAQGAEPTICCGRRYSPRPPWRLHKSRIVVMVTDGGACTSRGSW